MKTIMKKRIIWLMAILSVLALLTAGTVLLVTAETPVPTIDILGQNLVFENNIYIKYAVKIGGIENPEDYSFGMLYWTEPDATYEKGSEDLSETSLATETVAEQLCYIFTYKKLAAKEMADDIYARAYIEVDGNIYYSEVQKYSILQYAYNKLGITGTASTNENLKTMLRDMLQYGASAQIYFNYKTERLANADFRQINVVGGTLPNGSNQGLYMIGESVTLTAKETNADGIPFAYWKNSAGAKVGMDLTCTATIGEANESYTAVYAEIPATPDAYFTFTLQSDDTYSIAAKDVNNMPAEVVLPSTYNGKAVTNIGDSAFRYCPFTSITIPDSVTSIFASAFRDCTSLTSVTIGNSVTSIGNYAFRDCTSLTSVTIPDSVTSIGNYAFYNCYRLVEIYNCSSLDIQKGSDSNGYVGYYALNVYTSTAEESKLHTTDDGYVFCEDDTDCYLVAYRGSETDLTLPENYNGRSYKISQYAFYNCTSLTSITIPDSVTSIGNSTFWDCRSLTSIIIPDSVMSIGEKAFQWCTSLTSITIPDSVTSIGNSAFNDCGNLTSIIIPDSVMSIGEKAFQWCRSLTSITIPDSVTSIGDAAFQNCTGLTSVTIGNGVTSIGVSAFEDCTSLTSITIPDSVTSIGEDAFYYCTGLTSVTIPNSVTSIGEYTFFDCYRLVEVYNCSSLDIQKGSDSNGYVGSYALNVYTSTMGESKLHTTDDGYVFCEDDTDCYLIEYRGSETNLTLPESYNGRSYKINQYAFYNCTNLTSITIPDSVTSIGSYAFYQCMSLTSITIPDSVTSIGDKAFYKCESLTSITIPDSVTSIGNSTFWDCRSLTSITIPDSVTSIGNSTFWNCRSLTSITIPDSVTSIGSRAFWDCTSLTSITIGNGVTSIGNYAFSYCTSLTKITFADTSTWYRTTSSSYTGGTYTSVTTASTNATYFTSTYAGYYWYKK